VIRILGETSRGGEESLIVGWVPRDAVEGWLVKIKRGD